jgi:ornithine carbamoyltransferase
MHVLSIAGLNSAQVRGILSLAASVKKNRKLHANALEGKKLLLLFAKPSLRTRLSFESAAWDLGMHTSYYSLLESTIGKKESVSDAAKTISRYFDCIAARLYAHSDIEELAHSGTIPVINALTDLEHPCQALGDMLTIEEKVGLKNATIAYIGDCKNNVAHSLLLASAILGVNMCIAFPDRKGYAPNAAVMARAKELARKSGAEISVFNKAEDAVKGANIVYTDTWMSYQIAEKETKIRETDLRPFQVNSGLMKKSKNAYFMHCLPAARGKEVTDEVMDSGKSAVFDQAENRMHAEKALLLLLFSRVKF